MPPLPAPAQTKSDALVTVHRFYAPVNSWVKANLTDRITKFFREHIWKDDGCGGGLRLIHPVFAASPDGDCAANSTRLDRLQIFLTVLFKAPVESVLDWISTISSQRGALTIPTEIRVRVKQALDAITDPQTVEVLKNADLRAALADVVAGSTGGEVFQSRLNQVFTNYRIPEPIRQIITSALIGLPTRTNVIVPAIRQFLPSVNSYLSRLRRSIVSEFAPVQSVIIRIAAIEETWQYLSANHRSQIRQWYRYFPLIVHTKMQLALAKNAIEERRFEFALQIILQADKAIPVSSSLRGGIDGDFEAVEKTFMIASNQGIVSALLEANETILQEARNTAQTGDLNAIFRILLSVRQSDVLFNHILYTIVDPALSTDQLYQLSLRMEEVEKREGVQPNIMDANIQQVMMKKIRSRTLDGDGGYIKELGIPPDRLSEVNSQSGGVLVIGGGDSHLASRIKALGFTQLHVTNIDPTSTHNIDQAQVLVAEPFETALVEEGRYDEVWALYSLPIYSFTPNDVVVFYKKALRALAENGVFRVFPTSGIPYYINRSTQLSRRKIMEVSDWYLLYLQKRPKLFGVNQYERGGDNGATVRIIGDRTQALAYLENYSSVELISDPKVVNSNKLAECVTGDTLLLRRSSKFKVKSSKFKVGDDLDQVRIDQIKSGDEILSLNEETGKLEPRRIVQLLDKGMQEVYRLTTADGRSIETTENHPYLTRMIPINKKDDEDEDYREHEKADRVRTKAVSKKNASFLTRLSDKWHEPGNRKDHLFVEDGVGKQQRNDHESKCNEGFGIDIKNINSACVHSIRSLYASARESITPIISPVNMKILENPL